MKVIEVVAALIEKDNCVLATQRGYGEFKGMWEFPGGKIEENETREEALKREIKEEMNADIDVKDYLTTIEYDYPNFHLIMHTYLCELINDLKFVYHNDKELEHENMIWVEKDELNHIDFLPADIEVVNYYNKIKRLQK